MSNDLFERIEQALDWYEGTDGSEREDAAEEMYNILIEITENEKFRNYYQESVDPDRED